ncbi:MAG: Rrf2 family transcriptional regulator [Lentisphaerota bacterium]
MKLSTKGRYGVRFMLDLAVHHDEGFMTLKDVAARQEISEKYLWQVINPLKAAGLIQAARGSRGGFTLARPAAKINVWEIVSTLEGEDMLVECARAPDCCGRSEDCVVRGMWKELQDKMTQSMKAITLEQIAEKQKAGKKQPVNFSI